MRSFLWNNIMATDVDVQYFSHLNGLVLGNNWGDLIRLLDKTLVTGIAFTEITAASIDDQGDVHITLYSAHNALLFQVVELTGFTPNSFNQKYRIKGTPSATELILKPSTAIAEKNIITKGIGKLASLGYEIIFRDTGDVKRVYRAKNPHAEHPFIRVDESLTSPDGTTGIYNSSYAKSAMVGLLENMTHIDDYENPEVLQLPLDTTDLTKNWRIDGTGSAVVRGQMKWVWAISNVYYFQEGQPPVSGNRTFLLCGDLDAFYLCTKARGDEVGNWERFIYACGLFNSPVKSITKNWFLSAMNKKVAANNGTHYPESLNAFLSSDSYGAFYVPAFDDVAKFSNNARATPIVFDALSGNSTTFSKTTISALEIPFYDNKQYLRGSLKHLFYSGKVIEKNRGDQQILSENSMYLQCPVVLSNNQGGGVYFYIGELE